MGSGYTEAMGQHVTRYFFAALEFAPTIIKELIERLEISSLTVPTGPDRFTPQEAVAHLADWEPIFQARLRKGVETNGGLIEVYDESVRAIERGYATTDVQEALAIFREERIKTIEYVKSLSDEQLAHTITHPELGPVTVAAYAWTIIGHDVYHIEQLVAVLPN